MELNNTLTKVERGFNIAGSIPVVSIVSSSLRIVAGEIQALAGGILAAVSFAMGYIDKADPRKWDRNVSEGLDQLMHGVLNTLRGAGEAIAAATLIGSVALLIAQCISDNGFDPIIKYGSNPHLENAAV